jgi:hypothetical protein
VCVLGLVLVESAPECPGVAVSSVAAGVGDDGAAELPEHPHQVIEQPLMCAMIYACAIGCRLIGLFHKLA